jgi:hypothetical protein
VTNIYPLYSVSFDSGTDAFPLFFFTEIVHWINTLMSESLEKISFYKLTTEFAEYLKKTGEFDSIHVTGHSLGGGLAMITGAQAGISSVGKQSFCRACGICQVCRLLHSQIFV